MISNCFTIAVEGWKIITQNRVARKGARRLLLLIAEFLEARVAGIHFTDAETTYSWEERVDRYSENGPSSWNHPFPNGASWWFFEGTRLPNSDTYQLLDLLADQWLWLREQKSDPVIPPGYGLAPHSTWVAVSNASKNVLSTMPSICFSRHPLLLIGEHGTGRAHLAEWIHRNGPDSSLPFVSRDNSEKEGGDGTLFIPDWTMLNEEEIITYFRGSKRVIVAATHPANESNLRSEWNRLTAGHGLILTVPALRNRIEDIPLLASWFLEQLTVDSSLKAPGLSPPAIEALQAYSWPGNVRELKATMSMALDNMPGDRIGVGDLPPAIRGAILRIPVPSLLEHLAAMEYELLTEELRQQRGNINRTAKALNLTVRQVSWRIRKYNISPDKFKINRRPGTQSE